jgi:hypothetical protein
MRPTVLVALALPLALAAAGGCDRRPGPVMPGPPTDPPPRRSLAEGWEPRGALAVRWQWSGCGYHWKDGGLTACLGEVGSSERPDRPVYLVLARVPLAWTPRTTTELTGADRLDLVTDLDPDGGGGPSVRYAYDRAAREESFSVAGREYRPTDGRVFLVVATGPVTAVYQLAAGLGGLFDAPGPPDFGRLAAEVEALRSEDGRVRRFLAGQDPAADGR